MSWMTPYLLKRIEDKRWEQRAEIWRTLHQAMNDQPGWPSRLGCWLSRRLGRWLIALGQWLQVERTHLSSGLQNEVEQRPL